MNLFMSKKAVFPVILFFLSFSLSAQAGLKVILEENDGKLTILRSIGKTKELVIPGTINDKPVTAISEGAFINRGLTLVSIPDSVISIEADAFAGNQLVSVSIPNSITCIEIGVFMNNHLSNVIIPESVTTIGMRAFAYNPLTSITIGANVTFDAPPELPAFGYGFEAAYLAAGSAAGTYTRTDVSSTIWTRN